MQFKQWLIENELKSKQDTWKSSVYSPTQHFYIGSSILYKKLEATTELAKKLALENGLPLPTSQIAEGTQAFIFDTTDPNIILRMSHDDVRNSCEKIIELPVFQKTGGVNVVKKILINDDIIFSWKEKVIVNWLDGLTAKYKYDRKKQDAISELSRMSTYAQNEIALGKLLATLQEIPETVNLVKAIEIGLPTDDITFNNIGLSRPDSKFPDCLQVIDC
jgi:hypothetical protein